MPAHPKSPLFVIVSALLAPTLAHAASLAPIRATRMPGAYWAPVAFVQDPANDERQYVLSQGGLVYLLDQGVPNTQPFLDLRPKVHFLGEMGCLGLAFAPDYADSGRFYVLYNSVEPEGVLVLARFRRSAANPSIADPDSQFNLVFDGNPYIQRPAGIHNGGTLLFGPDGYLYFGIGETGLEELSQDPASMHGKIHRIDVDVADDDPIGYRVPLSNPFLEENAPPIENALPTFWHVGLRNPWKWSFDDQGRGHTDAMIIGDVGGAHYEEIDIAPAGIGALNFGWPIFEGFHKLSNLPPMYLPLVKPVHVYEHTGFNSITAGYVLRNGLQCSYFGRYFFADFGMGQVFSGRFTGEAVEDIVDHTADLFGDERFFIPSFGRDAKGNIYILRYEPGSIYRIESEEEPLAGDVSGDSAVDFNDLNLVLSQFGASFTFSDLISVLSNYGAACGGE